MKIRNDDNVLVMSGKDKGKTGKILKVLKKTKKVIIEGVNIKKRHMKKQGMTPGQIIEKEAPIDSSNVMLVCPFTKKPTRVGFVFVQEQKNRKKFRFSKIAMKMNKGEPKDYIIK